MRMMIILFLPQNNWMYVGFISWLLIMFNVFFFCYGNQIQIDRGRESEIYGQNLNIKFGSQRWFIHRWYPLVGFALKMRGKPQNICGWIIMFPVKQKSVVYPIFRRTHWFEPFFRKKKHGGPLQADRVEMPIQAFVGMPRAKKGRYSNS